MLFDIKNVRLTLAEKGFVPDFFL